MTLRLIYRPSLTPRLLSELSALDALAEAAIRKLTRAILLLPVGLGLDQKLATIEAAYALGDVQGVIDAIPFETMDAELGTLIKSALKETAEKAGAAEIWSRQLAGLRFDIKNPRAILWADTRAAEQVTAVGAESRQAVRSLINQAVRDGVDARSTGRLIREVVGLNERQVIAIANLQRKLEEDGISPARIDKLIQAASKRALRYRAEMIARTEIQTAQNRGQLEAWQQSADKGLLDRARVRKVWIANVGACPRCQAMEDASHANPVTLEGEFTGGADAAITPVLHPGCRCSMRLEFL